MGWEGEKGEELLAPLPPLDPYPFTREGRLYRRIEHELSLTQAVLKVGGLVLDRQRIEAMKDVRVKVAVGLSTPFDGAKVARVTRTRRTR